MPETGPPRRCLVFQGEGGAAVSCVGHGLPRKSWCSVCREAERQRAAAASEPVDTTGQAFIEMEGVHVYDWSPLPAGQGAATQVHLVFDVQGSPAPLILRLKTARVVDELVAALSEHRRNVWPME